MRHKPFPKSDELVKNFKCPFCSCEKLNDMGTPVDHESMPLTYTSCDQCDLIFMNPRPTQNWYNDLYQNEFWEVKKQKKKRGQTKFQLKKEALWAEKFIHFLNRVQFEKGRTNPEILEIGCAYGVIGKLIAQHYSGTSYGVEPSDNARLFAERETGVNIFCENMDQVVSSQEKDRFDLIIFSHVLENITQPAEALKAARRLLKPNGLILIDTPNNYCRKSWHIHHPYCFTLPSLRTLLGSTGLRIKSYKTWSRPKYFFSPIYLTLIAEKSKQEYPVFVDSLWGRQLSRLMGWLSFRLFCRGPFKKVNYYLARKMWQLTPEHNCQVEEITKRVERFEAESK